MGDACHLGLSLEFCPSHHGLDYPKTSNFMFRPNITMYKRTMLTYLPRQRIIFLKHFRNLREKTYGITLMQTGTVDS